MVRKGLGWAFMSEKMADQMEGIHKYEVKHPDGQPHARHTWVVSNQDAKQLRMVSSFLDFIAKQVFS